MTQRGKVAVSNRMLGFAIWARSRRFPSKGSYSREHSCVAGIFLFLNPGWVVWPSETELGEISDLTRRTG